MVHHPIPVKVCGMTCPEDARLAAELGASAIGLVFWPGSPRRIDVDTATQIVSALPPLVTVVGVFVNQPLDEVCRIAEGVKLGAVQLHGSEAASYCARVPLRVIKAIGVADERSLDALDDLPPSVTVLLDTHDRVRFGGTGRTFGWDLAARAARTRPVILAGGLNPENVGAAITTVRPYAVDVSSGVEAAPGIKDPMRMRSFFEAVRRLGRLEEMREG